MGLCAIEWMLLTWVPSVLLEVLKGKSSPDPVLDVQLGERTWTGHGTGDGPLTMVSRLSHKGLSSSVKAVFGS